VKTEEEKMQEMWNKSDQFFKEIEKGIMAKRNTRKAESGIASDSRPISRD
jgi:hypothetical protein